MKQAHKLLFQWYKKFGRHDLPWRKTEDTYHIYLSEIMLQQTQTTRVKEHFYPLFLKKYPTLKDLAKADVEDILSHWSGLGYYSRARNMHKCAQISAKNGFPKEQKELEKLPGIGKYTASAICSFAYKQNTPVVDTNIARVIKRYFALQDTTENVVWKEAKTFLSNSSPREHNLALMDLGSLMCTPKKPKCSQCPLMFTCKGKNEPELYTKTKKVNYENLELFLGVFIKNGKIALEKSTQNLYKGLLVLPNVDPIEENFLGSFKHSYTKYRIVVNLYKIKNLVGKKEWLSFEELQNAPISSMTKKAIKLIDM